MGRKAYVTISGLNTGLMDKVLRLISYVEKEKEEDLTCFEDITYIQTNDVEKIQKTGDGYYTFNVDVVNKDKETAETLSADWRTCPTQFPRIIINGSDSSSDQEIHNEVKRAFEEMISWFFK